MKFAKTLGYPERVRGFTEVPQHALDVVHLDDESFELEATAACSGQTCLSRTASCALPCMEIAEMLRNGALFGPPLAESQRLCTAFLMVYDGVPLCRRRGPAHWMNISRLLAAPDCHKLGCSMAVSACAVSPDSMGPNPHE